MQKFFFTFSVTLYIIISVLATINNTIIKKLHIFYRYGIMISIYHIILINDLRINDEREV